MRAQLGLQALEHAPLHKGQAQRRCHAVEHPAMPAAHVGNQLTQPGGGIGDAASM
jgi:hypothetical protein